MLKKVPFLPKGIRKRLKKLPAEIQDKFWKQLDLLFQDPSYPSLRHKRVQGSQENEWEFSITMNYRATYMIHGNDLVVTEIGKHEDVF